MKTYQDLIALGSNEKGRADFIISAIAEHKDSDAYNVACDAVQYQKQKNITINKCYKLVYDATGAATLDQWSANYKCASNFFNRFLIQQVAYLLGNGVFFEKEDTKKNLGATFDKDLYMGAKSALVQSCSFGFYNHGKIYFFELTEFVPLYDEENGALRAGIRFWQYDDDKPLRATLYEEDGYTDYIKRKDDTSLSWLSERGKRTYIEKVSKSEIDGTEIYDGRNYPRFPIVPLWGNSNHQSELVGLRENIDAYDLIKSGFANNLDDASEIYWTLENCGGMSEKDLAEFTDKIKRLRAADVDGGEGSKATAHTLEVPYQSRETLLKRLEVDMYNDYMALDVKQIAAGAVTATQINAAYEPMNNKADEFEFCVTDFIQGILEVAGIDDTPTYKRERIANHTEITEMVLSAADVLDEETILRKLPWLTDDEIEEIIRRKTAEEAARVTMRTNTDQEEEEGAEEENDGSFDE